MPTDPSLIPALEEELRQAKGTKPGGQESRPDRVAAIEEQLKVYRKAAKAEADELGKRAKAPKETAVAEPAPDDADAKPSKQRSENADAASAPETADAASE